MTKLEDLIRRVVGFTDIAAAVFLMIITLLTFIAVLMRYVFALPFPGSFDVSRLLLGVAIFWGIAVAAYRREHIAVDLFWQMMPRRVRLWVDIFGDLVFAGFIGLMAYMLLGQVDKVRTSGQTTFELSIPLWPFYGVAWLGIVLCFVVILARIAHVLFIDDRSARD